MDKDVVTTLCHHSFHRDCIDKWEDRSCPMCRSALVFQCMEEDAWNDIPPPNKLSFLDGKVVLTKQYRLELFSKYPHYCEEEIVRTAIGENPDFPGVREYHYI